MLVRLEHQISINKLCSKEDNILLAVSGGIDSIALLHLFHALGYKIGVAHCNFQLRGGKSNKDESFIRSICKLIKIPFYTTRFDTHSYAQRNKLSLQMAARELRYTWFSTIQKKEHYHYIAMAHQLNDNIETIIINLVRGTGIEGFKGIPIKTQSIIRPLLNFSRKDIEHYVQDNKISWREDATNSTTKYHRNKIRLQVIPKLKELNPSLENTFIRTQQRLQGAGELFSLGKKHLEQMFVTSDEDCLKIDKSMVSTVDNPIPILWEIIKQYGFNYNQCSDVVKNLNQNTGKKFLSKTHQLIIDRNHLIINIPQRTKDITRINQEDVHVNLGSWNLTITCSNSPVFHKEKNKATFDRHKITFPLHWRTWKYGDYFYPLGLNKRKKVSDFFIDEKFSLVDKDKATVVESNGCIIWIVGHRIDHRFRITDKTISVINLSLQL